MPICPSESEMESFAMTLEGGRSVLEFRYSGEPHRETLTLAMGYEWFRLPVVVRHSFINRCSQFWRRSNLLEGRKLRLITPTGMNGGGKKIGCFENGHTRYEVCDMYGNDESEKLMPLFGKDRRC